MKPGIIYEMIFHHYINKKKVTRPFDLSNGKKLLIMATGKSAGEYWDYPSNQERFKEYDMLVMNRSIYKMEKEVFEKKPRYFAACDPIYWGEGSSSVNGALVAETYQKTTAVLEKVDWDCYLITSIHEKFALKNEHIHIIRLNATIYDSNSEMCYKLYKGNFCSPPIKNVGQLALYFGITFGYKELAVMGMDFDFFKNLFCDENCLVGLYAEHQYDKIDGKVVEAHFSKEKYGTINNSVLAKYLLNISDTFGAYGKLSLYAEKMGGKIINYSIESMLDCYEKRRMNEGA